MPLGIAPPGCLTPNRLALIGVAPVHLGFPGCANKLRVDLRGMRLRLGLRVRVQLRARTGDAD